MVKGQNHFGKLLREAREAAGLTRTELGHRISLDASHIYRLEAGDRRPSQDSVIVLAEALATDGEAMSKWLTAAGYETIPDLAPYRAVVRTRGAVRSPASGGAPSSSLTAALRARLRAMGFQETKIDRLLRAMQAATPTERQEVAKAVSATLSRVAEMLEAPVRTAIIPAAGGHHRIVAAHVMQRLLVRTIGEAAESGISKVILVLAPGSMDSLYTPLKEALSLAVVPPITLLYEEQAKPEGLGDAILQAKDFIGNDPFAVLLPDDVVRDRIGRTAHPRELRRMMDTSRQLKGGNIVAVGPVPRSKMSRCGVAQVDAKEVAPKIRPILKLVEKPRPGDKICEAPRVFGIVGRYLLQPSVFGPLHELRRKGQSPAHLTDALEQLRQAGRGIYAFDLEAKREDLGGVIDQASELIRDSSNRRLPPVSQDGDN